MLPLNNYYFELEGSKSGGGITPTGTLEITENNLYAVSSYAYVNVNVPTGGGGDNTQEDGLIEGTLTSYSNSRVTSIRGSAFNNCPALTSVNIPNATSVSSNAFNNCPALTSVNIPNATSIGQSAFNGCKALTSIDLPLVTSIGMYAFQNCPVLINIDLPNAIFIRTSAFYNCYSLKAVIIRQETQVCSLESSGTFSGCYHINGTKSGTYNPNGDKDGFIYVPRSLANQYRQATNWSTYADQIRALEDYTVDGTTTGELDESKI